MKTSQTPRNTPIDPWPVAIDALAPSADTIRAAYRNYVDKDPPVCGWLAQLCAVMAVAKNPKHPHRYRAGMLVETILTEAGRRAAA